MNFSDAKQTFVDTIRRKRRLDSAAQLLKWDMKTAMPPKGAQSRAKTMGAIQSESFRLQVSKEFGAAIDTLEQNTDRLTPREARMLEVASAEYHRFYQIPANIYEAFNMQASESLLAWREARAKQDYSIYLPHLQKIIDYKRQFSELWGYEDKPYDAMLYDYDPELLTKDIDPIFNSILTGTRRLLQKLDLDKVAPLPVVTADRAHQKAVSEYLLGEIGFDLEAGRYANAEDGFTCYIHGKDIRIAAEDCENDPADVLFTALHEGGHGIFDQNIDQTLDDTNLYRGSMTIHESQSRLWENVVGRRKAFGAPRMERAFSLLGCRLAPDPDTFYQGINRVSPSLNRIKADELTYNLHIIVRYECEKAIFNDHVDAKDLRALWNDKYREYLGVVPANDTEGILQDIHWVAGEFGYFPSYTLGNVCAAQFAESFSKQYGKLDDYVGTQEGIATLRRWLNQNIHQYGKEKKTLTLVREVCKEGINPESFLRYIEEKLSDVYGGF